MNNNYILEMKDIYKNFGGVAALKNVSLRIKPAETHALIGENGSGKSTLMNILSGVTPRDRGEIFFSGEKVKINHPRDSKALGISTIYQDLVLAQDLSVTENIFIDKLKEKGNVFINWKRLHYLAKQLLDNLGFGNIDPREQVKNLTVAYQQIVEICKALTNETKILILDEPTSVLTFGEIEKLFAVLQDLKSKGVSIIYISHRLDEIYKICEKVTILKDGEFVNEFNTCDITKQELIYNMIGRELLDLYPMRNPKIGDAILEVKGLSYKNVVKDVSFKLHKGEILGFSGLVGSGRTDTMSLLFGLEKRTSGDIVFKGKQINFKNTRQAVNKKIGMIPEDRKLNGVLLDQSLRINTTLSNLKAVTMGNSIIKRRKETDIVKELLIKLFVKYGNIDDNVSTLSGGNQQKVAIAKWLHVNCECIIFDEPTHGVDVGAKSEIYKTIDQLANEGVGVIVISSEMNEIIGLCDRAIIMKEGRIQGELIAKDINEINLINMSIGGTSR